MKAKRLMVVLLALVAISVLPLTAQAALFTGDRDAFISAVHYTADVSLSAYPEFSVIAAGDPVALPSGKTLSFDIDLEVRQVPSSWATWSGGNQPRVLWTKSFDQVTGTFSAPVPAFGFEAEPNPFAVYDITLMLSDGSTFTQAVDGFGGAKFFGYLAGGVQPGIIGFTISSSVNFAFGRMIEGQCDPFPPAPIPGSLLLLGTGLLGLVGWRVRK